MEAAQAAIARHTSRRGHFTHVEETVRPAITSETIKPHRHEIVTEAFDREVHQHHYHTTVQPLSHTETLPTKHTHNLIPVKKTTHEHDDVEENKRRLAEFAALFRDISTTLPTTHSSTKHEAVVGEHVHHHVHEFVQPIIYKETVQRETVHTTIPIHEVHHNKARHHGMSSMPVKTMEEFLSFHAGRKDGDVRHSRHEGVPREYDSNMATTFEKLGLVSPAAATSTDAPVSTPKSASRIPPAINTTTSPTTTTTTTSTFRNPVTPTRKPVHRHHDATNQGLTSPNRRGSFSSDSSASSSAPSTPNSPTYRNKMLPKNNVMNTMPLNKEVMGPTTTTNTTTPNTNINTQTNTNTMVNTVPAKTNNATEPVRIVRNSGEGDMSPRYSSDENTSGNRRSLLGRLTGSRRSQHA